MDMSYGQNFFYFEEGWKIIQTGTAKLIRILEGSNEKISSDYHILLYTTIYNMCTQKPPHDYSPKLYDKYKETIEAYLTSTVLPSLREKNDEFLLRELVKRWENHKEMLKWLVFFFRYLDRFFVPRRSLPSLHKAGLTCFRDLVYKEINGKVTDAVISLIDQEREGEQIDRALLKNVLDIFVEIGMGQMECYENDFEASMLTDTAAYYSRKASNWIIEDSCPDYMFKANECLKKEKDRVSHYLHNNSEQKLLENVQHELLFVNATQLLEKEHSGCHASLHDNKVDDLSKMYMLLSTITHGLEPLSSIIKQQAEDAASNKKLATSEGTTVVKQEEDAASYKKRAEECLKREKRRVSRYLTDKRFSENPLYQMLYKDAMRVLEKDERPECHALLQDDKLGSSESISMVKQAEDAANNKKPQFIMVDVNPTRMLEKEHSGCHASVRDDKPGTSESISLVKQVEDAASNKKEPVLE